MKYKPARYKPPPPIPRLMKKTTTPTGIASQPRRTGAARLVYLSIARSHALLGAAGAGAHVPPTQVHCWSQEFTVRCVMSSPERARLPSVGLELGLPLFDEGRDA